MQVMIYVGALFLFIHQSEIKVFLFEFTESGFFLAAEIFYGRLYRVDKGTEQVTEIQAPGVFSPAAVEYDPVMDRVYWSDVDSAGTGESFIASCKMDGTDQSVLYSNTSKKLLLLFLWTRCDENIS